MREITIHHVDKRRMRAALMGWAGMDIPENQIAEALETVPVGTRNKRVVDEINSLVRKLPMIAKFHELTAMLQDADTSLKRNLVIKELCPYFLTDEGMEVFFKQARKSFVYGKTSPTEDWRDSIKTDYKAYLRKLSIKL